MDSCFRRNDGKVGIHRRHVINDKQPCVYTKLSQNASFSLRVFPLMSWFKWIPAFAGMTENKGMFIPKLSQNASFSLRVFPLMSWFNWIPAFAGMTLN